MQRRSAWRTGSRAHEDGAWVREAADAYADKQADALGERRRAA